MSTCQIFDVDLPDNDADLSDLYVDLSYRYVDLSDNFVIMYGIKWARRRF